MYNINMNFYQGLILHIQYNFILSIIDLIIKSKVRPETTPTQWIEIVSFMHERGWLYYGYENGRVVTVLGAYRIKEFVESKEQDLPDVEEGNIVYVPFAVSISKDRLLIRKITTEYLEKHPEVEEIIFRDDAKDKYISIKIGENNGKSTATSIATSTNVSTEP